MIIDSHAHYTHHSFQNRFRCLAATESGYTIEEADRDTLLQQLHRCGISCSIEPGISLVSCEDILALAAQYPDRIFPAIGLHPTRSFLESWSDRKKLDALANVPGVIAIGETGLDYHYPRKEQHRLTQHAWFLYQLGLAQRRKLPLILHVRDAHRDALRILKLHPARKLGGVVHCFTGTAQEAQDYLALGYYIGIGGVLLQENERGERLRQALAQIPLERILIETDAPFILPSCQEDFSKKLLRKTRNTSLILPHVIARIAQLKGLTPQQVEQETAQNVIRLFRLPIVL